MRRSNRQLTAVFLILTLLGIGIILSGVSALADHSNFMKKAVETSAVVTNIFKADDDDNEAYDRVQVKFSVDGKEYKGELRYRNAGAMSQGDTVTVYYNPDDPQDFRAAENSFVGLRFVSGLGLCFMGMIVFFINMCQKRKRFKIR